MVQVAMDLVELVLEEVQGEQVLEALVELGLVVSSTSNYLLYHCLKSALVFYQSTYNIYLFSGPRYPTGAGTATGTGKPSKGISQ